MSVTQRLLARIKERTGIHSDYGLAKALGISRQRMSTYANDISRLEEPDLIIRASELAGDDPRAVAAALMAERAKTPAGQRLWMDLENLARAAGKRAAAAAVAAGVTVALLAGAMGSPTQGKPRISTRLRLT